MSIEERIDFSVQIVYCIGCNLYAFLKSLEVTRNQSELDNTWKRLESNRNLDLPLYLQLTTDLRLDNAKISQLDYNHEPNIAIIVIS